MKKESIIGKLIENPKSLIAVAIGIVIIGLLIYFIIRRAGKKVQGVIDNTSEKIQIQEHINETGEKPSYSDFEYKSMADRLYNVMNGCGTWYEEDIIDVMNKMNNLTDVMKLNQAFGTRGDENLAEWLHGDLSGSWINKINNILKNKGISYSF